MALPIDQKEYLKRYLSADSEDQNKKKRRKKVKTSVKVTRTFTIVDDDVDIHALAPGADKQDEINNPLMDDEMPLVAGVIDERPKDEVLLEQYRTSNKWKLMGQDGQAKQKKDQGLMTRRKNRHDSTDSDLSPPRKQSHGKRDVDSDVSPSRQRQRAEEFSDLTPPRKKLDRQNRKRGDGSSSRLPRHDTDSDVSPPRNRQETKGDRSHTKKKRHDSDSDLSPPRGRQDRRDNRKGDRPHVRQKRHDSDSDLSPPRRRDDRIENTKGDRTRVRQTRHDSDSDMSPRRREKDKRGSKSSEKSQTSHARHDSDADLSPPRRDSKSRGPVTNRRTKQGSDSDLSPPRRDNKGEGKNVCRSPTRRTRHDSDSDLSPPRKGQLRHSAKRGNKSGTASVRHDMDSDMSPLRPKRKGDSDSDLSPVRKSVPQKGRRDPKAELSPRDSEGSRHAERTLAGTSAGLSDAKTMRRENEDSRRRNTDMYSKMDNELSGRNAKTIFRDKTGRTRDLESEKRKKREDETKKTQEDQKFVEWGKGVAQSAQQKSSIQDALHEMSKPLARYRDDQELDEMLKEAEREGDPMMQFLKKKSSKKQAATGVKALPKYKGPLPPPNRFNIMPGYRWDGVNRSSGFEKKFFERQADKKAMKEVAYKWSTEDM